MSYRTISTIATPESGDALEAAISSAIKWSAHLDVLCIGTDIFAQTAMLSAEMGALPAALVEQSVAQTEALEKRLRTRLTNTDITWDIEARTDSAVSLPYGINAKLRFSDLTVLPLMSKDTDATMESILEATLKHSTVPVLMTDADQIDAMQSVMIAWDGSGVALAAIRAALPILRAAGQVQIVTIDPEHPTEGHDLAVMLDRHGIKANVIALPSSHRKIGEGLCDHARESGADLIVMGAYGNRRLRDLVLGGTTLGMLQNAPVPLFLAH